MYSRKSLVSLNNPISRRSSMTLISSSAICNLSPRDRKRKCLVPPLNLAIIEEERALSEYDCGYMDLGAETPSTYHCFTPNYSLVQPGTGAGLTVPHILSRRNSFHLPSSPAANRLRKYSDRDCGIWYAGCVISVFPIQC